MNRAAGNTDVTTGQDEVEYGDLVEKDLTGTANVGQELVTGKNHQNAPSISLNFRGTFKTLYMDSFENTSIEKIVQFWAWNGDKIVGSCHEVVMFLFLAMTMTNRIRIGA